MKAVRIHEFGDPEVMRVEDIPELEPGAGQVVVRVKAAGVNPVDTYLRAGIFPVKPDLPWTPGMDAAGVVEAVGDGVKQPAVGDRVYVAGSLSGTYAEQVLCQASQVHPLPEHVSFAQGAVIGIPYATAYRALFQLAHAVPGEVVLVHGGTGGVGVAAVQLARAADMTVIATGGTDRGRAMITAQGADHVLDHHSAAYPDRFLELTNGRGVDVVLEMLANVNLNKDIELLAMGGRIIVIGCRGDATINPRGLMGREATIRGMVVMNASDSEAAAIHAAIVAGLTNQTLDPVVNREMPLADAPKAHHDVIESTAHGKIVLVP